MYYGNKVFLKSRYSLQIIDTAQASSALKYAKVTDGLGKALMIVLAKQINSKRAYNTIYMIREMQALR